jgi:hypothetical protein
LLDGLLPHISCWMRSSGDASTCTKSKSTLNVLWPGLGILSRVGAGLMYWYLRGMGELRSVEDFLLRRERRSQATPPQE